MKNLYRCKFCGSLEMSVDLASNIQKCQCCERFSKSNKDSIEILRPQVKDPTPKEEERDEFLKLYPEYKDQILNGGNTFKN